MLPFILSVHIWRFHWISWFNINHGSLCVSVFQNVAESSECHSFMSFNTCYTDTGLWWVTEVAHEYEMSWWGQTSRWYHNSCFELFSSPQGISIIFWYFCWVSVLRVTATIWLIHVHSKCKHVYIILEHEESRAYVTTEYRWRSNNTTASVACISILWLFLLRWATWDQDHPFTKYHESQLQI